MPYNQPSEKARYQMKKLLSFLDEIDFSQPCSKFSIEEISFHMDLEELTTRSKGISCLQTAKMDFETSQKFEKALRSTFIDLLLENDDKEMFSNSLTLAIYNEENFSRVLDLANLEKYELLDHLQPKIEIFFLVQDIITESKKQKSINIEEILFFAKEININQKFSSLY